LVASQVPADYDEVKVSLHKQTKAFYKPLRASKKNRHGAALSIFAQRTWWLSEKTNAGRK
jgi:hypothetical protein